MIILCQGRIEKAKEFIEKADYLGPAGLTLVKTKIGQNPYFRFLAQKCDYEVNKHRQSGARGSR